MSDFPFDEDAAVKRLIDAYCEGDTSLYSDEKTIIEDILGTIAKYCASKRIDIRDRLIAMKIDMRDAFRATPEEMSTWREKQAEHPNTPKHHMFTVSMAFEPMSEETPATREEAVTKALGCMGPGGFKLRESRWLDETAWQGEFDLSFKLQDHYHPSIVTNEFLRMLKSWVPHVDVVRKPYRVFSPF